VYFFFIKLLIHFKFFYGHKLFHLDNPVPYPVEEKTISNPNPKNFQYPAGLDSEIRCQAKLLTSANFLTCYCYPVILLIRIQK